MDFDLSQLSPEEFNQLKANVQQEAQRRERERIKNGVSTPKISTKTLDLSKDHTNHQTGKLGLADAKSAMRELMDVS